MASTGIDVSESMSLSNIQILSNAVERLTNQHWLKFLSLRLKCTDIKFWNPVADDNPLRFFSLVLSVHLSNLLANLRDPIRISN